MHAYEIPGLQFSLPAGVDIARRRFVSINSNSAAIYAAPGAAALGVSMDDAKAGEVLIISDGILMVDAGAAVTAGQDVEVGANGKAIPNTSGIGVGVALTSATADGHVITVKLLSLSNADGTDGEDGLTTQTISYTASDLAAGADLADAAIGAVPSGFTAIIVDASVISLGTAEDIDASNTSVFALEVGSTALAGLTFNADVAFPGSGESAALTLVPDIELDGGDVLLLSVTNGNTADLPAFLFQVTLALALAPTI